MFFLCEWHSCDAGGGDVSRKGEGVRGGTGVCWGGGLNLTSLLLDFDYQRHEADERRLLTGYPARQNLCLLR